MGDRQPGVVTTDADDWGEFERLTQSLSPYLDQLVVVGGWAHRLHALDERATRPDFEPLMTLDVDLALPDPIREQRESIDDLLIGAGLRLELAATRSDPSTRYRVEGPSGITVEFVTPLRGSTTRRDGTYGDTASIAGVTAMRLRHMDLLLMEPWVVRLRRTREEPPKPDALQIRVANPASFIAQKLLVLSRRTPAQQAKDALYVHDTLVLFSRALPSLASIWQRLVRNVPAKQRREIDAIRREKLEVVTDVVRRAAVIAAQTSRRDPPPPERFALACRLGLNQVFGG